MAQNPTVFDVFNIPAPAAKLESKELPKASVAKVINDRSRPAHATFSRAEAAALLELYILDANDEDGMLPGSSQDDMSAVKMRSTDFSNLMCDARRPAGATFSRAEAAELLVSFNTYKSLFSESPQNSLKLAGSTVRALLTGTSPQNSVKASSGFKPMAKIDSISNFGDADIAPAKDDASVSTAVPVLVPTTCDAATAAVGELDPVPFSLPVYVATCMTYCKLMTQTYPGVCKQAVGQAFSDIMVKGKVRPTDIFKEWAPLNFKPLPKYGHYAGQIVFRSRFEDREKLNEAFVSVAADCKFPEELVNVSWDDETTVRPYSDDNAVQASNHYIHSEKEHYNFKKHSKQGFTKYVAAIQCYETLDQATGEWTTVFWLYLPGKTWDGTSCFNFLKEVVGRYYGETNPKVVKAEEMLTMTEECKKALDSPLHILRYLLLLPLAIFLNLSATLWEKADAKHVPNRLGAKGDREMAFLNLTAKQSKEMCSAFKAAGMPPTAGLLYALCTAYQRHVGCYPFGINLQASLQTRGFVPVIKERYFIGDWLIGPCYKVRRAFDGLRATLGLGNAEYWRPEDAKTLYAQLIDDVTNCSGRVREAFVAREYGVIKGGPAPYQNQNLYGDINRMNDSILFNNYGPRFVHPEAKAVSWNWTGPGKLDCNTISVNGCTSITLASTVMGIEKVTSIRNEMKDIIDQITAKSK